MKVYYDKDADLSLIKGKKVTIIGYGSQGHAHAQNLTDSGVKVTVGLRPGGASWEKVKKAKIAVKEVGEAVKGADFVMILLPDENHAAVYKDSIEPNIKKGATLAFAHGFNIHFRQIMPRPDLDVVMIAPKGPGHLVRQTYTQGGGVPALIAIHQNASGKAKDLALSYAAAIGGTRGGVIETNFREETETDLFGEQTVPVRRHRRAHQGGLRDAGRGRVRARDGVFRVPARDQAHRRPHLRGRHREHELLDLQQRGVRRVRDGAQGHRRGVEEGDEECLARIQSGEYARDFILENRAGAPTLNAKRRLLAEHDIEVVGEKLRAMMPWIKKNKLVDTSRN
jgi:ketol-acid reductoisomerase